MASILVSEVERDVRRLLTTVVERLGHEAIVLQPGVDVPPRADAMLVDPYAPASVEHIRLVRSFFPELPLVCMWQLPDDLGPIGPGPVLYLAKPFAPEQLAFRLAQALGNDSSPGRGRTLTRFRGGRRT